MKHVRTLSIVAALALLLVGGLGTTQAQGPLPQGGASEALVSSAFSYQGQLNKDGSPVNDTCDMQFKLYDAASSGAQVGATLTRTGVSVSEGLFTVPDLDFGDVFSGDARWLEVAVQCTGDAAYVVLSPLQSLTAAPYALSLRPGADVIGAVPIGLTVEADQIGVSGSVDASDGYGIYGFNGADSGEAAGVFGQNNSTDGQAVIGYATSATGQTSGVWGYTASTAGRGVYGYAGATTGTTSGVYGQTDSQSGRGITGNSVATTGTTAGVYGIANSPDGFAVRGINYADSGLAYGVRGQTLSTAGVGVSGFAAADTGTTYGVHGESSSANGYGVYGTAPVVGVFGETTSTGGGWGIYGSSTATTGFGRGVYGTSASADGRGVYGVASAATGTTYGVYGRAESPDGRGVYGGNSATTGTTYGVWGEVDAPDGRGVFGRNNSTSGGSEGVYGAVYSPEGRALLGINYATTGSAYGVYGRSDSTTGMGVYGLAESTCDWGGGSYCGGVVGENTGGAGVLGVGDDGIALGGVMTNGSTGLSLLEVGGGTFIYAAHYFPFDAKFIVESDGDVKADGTFTSPAADVAELLPAAAGLEPGDVLVIGPDGQLARSTQAYQPTVVGVYSTKPAFLGGAEIEDEINVGKVPLAVVGVVPVKVSAENGSIQPGDLLVASSTAGHAMRAGANPAVGTVVGKALAGLDSGTGVILMLVVLQ